MKYRELDTNWDYAFGKGIENYLTSKDAVVQAVQSRLKLLMNEWWEDLEDGLPLFQAFIGKSNIPTNKQSMDLLVQRRINETPGVISISEFESKVINRQYIASTTLNTVYGDTEIEVRL